MRPSSALAAAPLSAQDYPSKPIRLIVPFAAGGPADSLARAIGPPMSAILKQPVVIENKAGAGGALGVDTVAKAAPDGYTIGISGGGALVIIPFMTRSALRRRARHPADHDGRAGRRA